MSVSIFSSKLGTSSQSSPLDFSLNNNQLYLAILLHSSPEQEVLMVNRRLALTLAPQFVVHLENEDNFIKERMECRTYLSNIQNKLRRYVIT